MTNDRFWKSFWLLFSGATLLCIAVSASIFFAHVGSIDTAVVGMDYTPDKDPFETSLHAAAAPVLAGGFLYKDALPLGLNTWAWDATLDWRSSGQVYEGGYALRAVFTKEWAGFGVSGIKIDTTANKTLSLAVRPDGTVGDLYIEAYDKNGVELGRQSLGWYTPGGSLPPNQWQLIAIPIQNLLGSSTSPTITALSLSTTNPGTVYVDAIQFTSAPSSHAPWVYVEPDGYVEPPFNPFATSTAISLPYTQTFSVNNDDEWYSLRGFFEQDYNEFKIGPQKGGNADSLALLRGGKAWTDYEVTATVTWGTTRVFALIARMSDENNYVSCSFSNQSDTIQMYDVQNGVSTLVTQSDKLHYSDYTGGNGHPGATVQGNTLSCSIDGKQILQKVIADIPARGTVGMEAWDQDDTLTAHEVTSFTVLPVAGE